MEARKPSRQAVDARTTDTKLKSAKPRRVRLRSLATQALCGFLAIVALLTLPMQVQAQTTIWSSTLTVKTLATSSFGCNLIATNRCSTYLSDNDFTYDRTTFTIQAIFIYPPDSLRISLNNGLPAAAESLTLNIDGTNFAFEDRGYHSDDSVILWNNAGLSWTAGNTVSLTLMDPNRRPGTPEIPAAPWVGATDGSNDSLDVGWLEPALAGHFVKYYLRYRQEIYVPWTDGPQNITSTFGKIDHGTERRHDLRSTGARQQQQRRQRLVTIRNRTEQLRDSARRPHQPHRKRERRRQDRPELERPILRGRDDSIEPRRTG